MTKRPNLVKGQEPIPDTMMVAEVSLRLGDQMFPLADILRRYCTASPVAHSTFDNDDVELLPVTIAMPDGIELVLPCYPSCARGARNSTTFRPWAGSTISYPTRTCRPPCEVRHPQGEWQAARAGQGGGQSVDHHAHALTRDPPRPGIRR